MNYLLKYYLYFEIIIGNGRIRNNDYTKSCMESQLDRAGLHPQLLPAYQKLKEKYDFLENLLHAY